MKRFPLLLAVLTLSACAGAKLEKQRAEIEDLQTKAGSLYSQLRESADVIEGLKTAKSELEAKVVEVEGRAAAAEGRVTTLTKSNKALSEAIGASKDELGGKLNAVVAEKDELARKLSETEKEKLALARLKTVYQSARERSARELAKIKGEREELLARLAAIEAAAKAEEEAAKRAVQARTDALRRTREEMGTAADAVLKEMQAGLAAVEQDGEGFAVTLSNELLFEEGSEKITEKGAALLGRLGAALKALPAKRLRVEAHSDNAPFKKPLIGGYAGHWELSAARATAAARWLHEHAGLDPGRLSAAGFGEFRPAKSNGSAEGRAANRRVEILVVPEKLQ